MFGSRTLKSKLYRISVQTRHPLVMANELDISSRAARGSLWNDVFALVHRQQCIRALPNPNADYPVCIRQ